MPESGTRVRVCGICSTPIESQTQMRLSVHRECKRMQDRGLLFSGFDSRVKDSTGARCGGCNSIIAAGEKHAHRRGTPFHRECLH
jgi:hypothetical protein